MYPMLRVPDGGVTYYDKEEGHDVLGGTLSLLYLLTGREARSA